MFSLIQGVVCVFFLLSYKDRHRRVSARSTDHSIIRDEATEILDKRDFKASSQILIRDNNLSSSLDIDDTSAYFMAVNVLDMARDEYSSLSYEQDYEDRDTIPAKLRGRILTSSNSSSKAKPKAKKSGRFPPPNVKEQSLEEREYLALHKCRDSGEAYSASYLITKQYLIGRDTSYNLTWVNCEMGSFIMLNHRANPQKNNINGTIIQSLDVLDFSVIHLSAYERLQRRWSISVKKVLGPKFIRNDIDPVVKSAQLLKEYALKTKWQGKYRSNDFSRTVVVMPFLGSNMGAGHSVLNNRLQYLHACFWSFYLYTPNIVAFVLSEQDYNFTRYESGLPWYEVVLLTGLPKSAALPVATVQQTKARLMDGRWKFDYMFFTESDQILMFRIPDTVFGHLKKYPNRVILPHRLMPYPENILHARWNRTDQIPTKTPFDWQEMNCCIARQNCGNRKGWIAVGNISVPIINAYGLLVPLGNANFHEEKYRICRMNEDGDWPYCP